MRHIKLTLAYDGSEFHGWQIQPGVPTVQGLLTDALRQITQEQLMVQGASRTDAGVHAWGQVAAFKTEGRLSPADFLRAANALLPPAIRVRAAEEVAEDFHPRRLALAKTYRYRIYSGNAMPPFWRHYVLHYPYPLDVSAMSAAARHFEGFHDFAFFAASTGSEEEDRERTTIRTIHRSEFMPDGDAGAEASPVGALQGVLLPFCDDRPSPSEKWVYIVRGQSFLRYMVRKMVGALLEVGCGRVAPQDIPDMLKTSASPQRIASEATAPPHGLCLMSVEYPR